MPRAMTAYGKLHALGGPDAVIAAPAARDEAAFDEWSGGFDMHLGVYTQDYSKRAPLSAAPYQENDHDSRKR